MSISSKCRGILLLLVAATMISATAKAQERSRVVLKIDNQNYYIHHTTEGETLGSLATLYGITEEELRLDNPALEQPATAADSNVHLSDQSEEFGQVQPSGQEVTTAPTPLPAVVRIACWERTSRMAPRRSDKRFERHVVTSGQSLMDVAVEYAISLDTLLADNPGVDVTNISKLRTVNIRKSCKGLSQLATIEQSSRKVGELLAQLSTEYDYFIVEAGQTLFSLAFGHNIGVEQLAAENGNPTLLQVGQVLKCPRPTVPQEEKSEFLPATQTAQILDSIAVENDTYAPFDKDVLTVSMLLPLTSAGGSKIRGSFVDFYQGALLAAEDLKAEGRNIELHLFDIEGKDMAQMEEYVLQNEIFDQTDLFIGPVYEDALEPLVEMAAETGKVVVSPLTAAEGGEWGRSLYRMAPTKSTRTDKLANMIAPETNVIMVYTASNDEEMESEMLQLLGQHPYGKVIYNEQFEVDSLNSRPIEELMVKEDNLFIILADNEIDTDRSLAIISSMMNSRQPRYGTRRVPIRVIGNSAWERYKNMDKNLLFKLDVSYVAPYHADRGNDRVKEFDRRFIAAFGRQPSTFAYRAYDTMKLFGSAIWAGGDLTAELNGSVAELLQVPYSFVEQEGAVVNDSWALVNYRPNYTIEVR